MNELKIIEELQRIDKKISRRVELMRAHSQCLKEMKTEKGWKLKQIEQIRKDIWEELNTL
jgi:hypothetical protein